MGLPLDFTKGILHIIYW